MLGQDHPPARGPDLVPGASHPLHPDRDARRGLDLDDEVDRSHVDAEFQAGGGHHRGQPPGLEVVLDERSLLPADAAVMGSSHLDRGRVGRPAGPGVAHQLRRGALLGSSRHGPVRGPGLVGGNPVGGIHPVGVCLVQPGAQPFGEPPGVGEHDRRAVGEDEVEDPLLDGGPDRRLWFRPGLGPVEAGHVRNGYDHVDL